MRPSMLLAAADVRGARALIERGIAADGSLGWRGAPPVQARFVVTGDALRSVRSRLYP
ncbi:MAG: TIGR03790 family protein, partial [Methylibium sp.]|nr:TIGR03790 family protein [Methylibium sp.]